MFEARQQTTQPQETGLDRVSKILAGSTSRRTALKGIAALGLAAGLSALGIRKAAAQEFEEPLLPLANNSLVRASVNNQFEHALIRAALVREGDYVTRTPVIDHSTGQTWNFYDVATPERIALGPETVSEHSQLVDGYPNPDFIVGEKKAGNPYGFVVRRGISYLVNRAIDLGYVREGDCADMNEGYFYNTRFGHQADESVNHTVYRHLVTKQPNEVCYPPVTPPQEAPRICIEEDNLIKKGEWYSTNGQVGTAGDGKFYLPPSPQFPNGRVFETHDSGPGSEKTSHYTIVAFEDGDVLPPGQVIRYEATNGDANIWCANRDFDICNNLNQYLQVWDPKGQIAMVNMLILRRSGEWDLVQVDAAPFRNQAYCQNYDV